MGSLNHSHCLIGAWSPPINGGSDSGKTFGFQLLGLLALLQVKLLWKVQLGIKQNIKL
jgi:hypothetical protein